MAEKSLVDKKEALKVVTQVAPSTPPSTPPKTYRFIKTMSPAKPVKLKSGEIKFYQKRTPEGWEHFGTFSTTDEVAAKELLEFAKNNPNSYIYEN